MRALCYDPDADAGLRLADTAEPVPGADEALVAIVAIALNVGEVTSLAERKQPGDVLGWTRPASWCSLRLMAPARPPAPG